MDLNTFFSYCGTVSHSQLINSHRKEDQQSSQFALVTFAQPYALKTALLLNDAIIVDSRICILPLRNSTSHDPNSDDYIMSYKSQQISLLGSKERDILWRSIKIQD
ncbi:RNA recognition motif domain [Macleaya cordata]|uniref:RNA recognition motif domain n=1 Tax=Macleaya cordata TaxID=56857 RepID=A0A200R3N9_MACCD|nr:RNA recognition motif domain [Macleaya cordata]